MEQSEKAQQNLSKNKVNQSSSKEVKLLIKILVELNNEIVIGNGRLQLIETIDETGSIYKAAKHMNMSYRSAWGKIKAVEDKIGIPLFQKNTSGKHGGTLLTPEAKKLLETYKGFMKESQSAIVQIFKKHFADYSLNIGTKMVKKKQKKGSNLES